MAKTINDPVHGFITIPYGLLLDTVSHPLMQRLTRIKQLGLSSFVYPGAQHTRFQHSIGAYHLTSEAIQSLARKGIFIFDSEAEAVEAAILMHDIGHGPFSHVLENTLIHGIDHEEISLKMMEVINNDFNGRLNLAICIFKNQYNKHFLHQLISSQLDMDRLDYMQRDSFFTGVQEGAIGAQRILKMLNVVDDNLVIEAKGVYSIENYLISRRTMYWQGYLHKTVVAAEKVLINLLRRAKHLANKGEELFASPALAYFLYNDVTDRIFREDDTALRYYSALDDNDIWTSVKVWLNGKDKILSTLANNLINRKLYKVEVADTPFDEDRIEKLRKTLSEKLDIPIEDTDYFFSTDSINKHTYDMEGDNINILTKDDKICEICGTSDMLNAALHSKQPPKYLLAYQRC